LAWALFITYECIVVRLFNGTNGSPWAYLLHYIIIISVFYLHADTALPWALKNKFAAAWRLPVIVIVEVIIYIRIYYEADVFLQLMHVKLINGEPHLNYIYYVENIYRAVYFLGFSSAYYFLVTYNKERKRVEELERQRLNEIINRQHIEQELARAQNAFLKAQINPHFLFNTLDFIYHNVMELSPRAAEAIIALSEMMRYAIDADKMGEFILIGDEIEQVQNLQYLNRLRKNEEMPLRLIYADEIYSINFIPLVLLTLAENIFKHGNLLNRHEATMEIYIDSGLFIIETDNLSISNRHSTSHRTGLFNIEQRLKHAYGNDIYFNYYHDKDDHFRVQIKVPVSQLGEISGPLSA
jgi:two-component system LytT family sensor kinase